MIRLLSAAPAVYDLPQLYTLAAARFGAAFTDVNTVTADDGSTQVAVYVSAQPDQSTRNAWAADLAAYTVSHPTSSDLAANQATLMARAQAALTANATFLAIATPTNAQVGAQVQTLTKECSALLRLLLMQFDTVAGT